MPRGTGTQTWLDYIMAGGDSAPAAAPASVKTNAPPVKSGGSRFGVWRRDFDEAHPASGGSKYNYMIHPSGRYTTYINSRGEPITITRAGGDDWSNWKGSGRMDANQLLRFKVARALMGQEGDAMGGPEGGGGPPIPWVPPAASTAEYASGRSFENTYTGGPEPKDMPNTPKLLTGASIAATDKKATAALAARGGKGTVQTYKEAMKRKGAGGRTDPAIIQAWMEGLQASGYKGPWDEMSMRKAVTGLGIDPDTMEPIEGPVVAPPAVMGPGTGM